MSNAPASSETVSFSPGSLLRLASEHVPAVRYALGVGGVAAVVAIVLTVWKLDPQTAAFGTLIVFAFMVVLVLFAALSKTSSSVLRPLSLFLAWSFLLLAIAVACLFVSCAFFDAPKSLPCLLKGDCEAPRPQAATRYNYASGSFERVGSDWMEKNTGAAHPFARFDELRRDTEHIYLVDRSRIKEGYSNNFLHVRLPIAGGHAQWSWQNPIYWQDLHIVEPSK